MSVDPKTIHADASQRDWRAFVLRWLRAIGKVPEVAAGDAGKLFEVNDDEDGYQLIAQGAGGGLNADQLDGQHGAFYRNASNLDAGTIGDARLPGTVPHTDEANSFTALQQFASIYSNRMVIDDDSIRTITPAEGYGVLTVSRFGSAEVVAGFRAASSPTSDILVQRATLVEVSTGALSGTTGTDGKITISAKSDGTIDVENRVGGGIVLGFLVGPNVST